MADNPAFEAGYTDTPPAGAPATPPAPPAQPAGTAPPRTLDPTRQQVMSLYGGSDASVQQLDKLYGSAFDTAKGYYDKADAIRQDTYKDVLARDERINRMSADPLDRPKPPTLQGLPEEPKSEYRDPTEAFGGVMSQLALLGSLFTRAPATAALNAAADTMKGFHQGDKERIELDHKRWEMSVQKVQAQNDKELAQYRTVLEDARLSADDRNARIQALATANHDQVMLTQLRTGGYEAAADLVMKRAQAGGHLIELTQKNQELFLLKLATLDQKNTPTLDQDTLRYAAFNYKKTNQMPPLGMASTADRKAIVSMAAHMDDQGNVIGSDAPAATASPGAPGATDAGPGQPPKPSSVIDRAREDIVGRASNKAGNQTLAALEKQSGFIEKFEGQMLKNMDVAEGLLDKGSGSDIGPVINRWIQGGRRATSDKDVADLNTAIFAVAMEYAKISSGSTGAAGSTDSSKAEAQEIVNRLDSADTIRSVFGIMRTEAHNAVDSNNEQIKKTKDSIRGTPAPDNAGTRGAAQGVPLPTEHANDPDGTTYNNGAYIKRGNVAVPRG